MDNRKLVETFWDTLYRRDFEALGAFFAEDGHYEDVPAPDPGATGPENVIKRLKIGLEPIERYEHELHRMVCEGDTVVTEHTETWHWHSGESVALPFVSIHVIRDGRIQLWRDYWDLQTLMSGAPAWWIERLATYSAADFPDADPSALAALRSLRRSYGYGSVARLASAASRRPGRRTPSWVRLLAQLFLVPAHIPEAAELEAHLPKGAEGLKAEAPVQRLGGCVGQRDPGVGAVHALIGQGREERAVKCGSQPLAGGVTVQALALGDQQTVATLRVELLEPGVPGRGCGGLHVEGDGSLRHVVIVDGVDGIQVPHARGTEL